MNYKYFVVVLLYYFQVSVLHLSINISNNFLLLLCILTQMSVLSTPYIFRTGLLLWY